MDLSPSEVHNGVKLDESTATNRVENVEAEVEKA